MNEEIFKEDLSISYLRAVAAKAQIEFELRRRDVFSKDVNLSKRITLGDLDFVSELNIQLKSTNSKSQYSESKEEITYALNAKNYNDLCKNTTTPIILCLLILPEDKEEWVTQTTEELIMKRCMYWLSLKGYVPTANQSTCSVKIPKTNIVSADSLNEILIRIAVNGGEL